MIASVQSAIVLLAALWTGFSDEDSHGLADQTVRHSLTHLLAAGEGLDLSAMLDAADLAARFGVDNELATMEDERR